MPVFPTQGTNEDTWDIGLRNFFETYFNLETAELKEGVIDGTAIVESTLDSNELKTLIGAGVANGVATLNSTAKVVQELDCKGQASGCASLNASSKVVEEPASKGIANGVASLNASSKVVETALLADVASSCTGNSATATTASGLVDDVIIDVSIIETLDFSGTPVNIIHKLFPWSTPTKLANPGTLPTGNGNGCSWSPNGEFLAITHFTTPYILIYQRSGTTFTKLANPATLPTGNGRDCSWSPNGEFLAVAHDTTPFITIYQRSGTTFTKLANPGTLPTGFGRSCSWSSNGEFLAVAHDITPFVTIYQTSGNMPEYGYMKVINIMREGT